MSMTSRRLNSPTIVFAAAAAILAGAGVAQATELTLVEVLNSPPRTELLRRQIDDFTKANPDITVKIISVPYHTSFEKVTIMFKSGQAPDVVELADRWGGLFVRGNNCSRSKNG